MIVNNTAAASRSAGDSRHLKILPWQGPAQYRRWRAACD
jgi:hypothetical protein